MEREDVRIEPLARADRDVARSVLAAACAFDRADVVTEEKLFGAAATGEVPRPVGAWIGDALVGVASIATDRVRIVAVDPRRRGSGIGSALLARCESDARDRGVARLRIADEPGNYLAPGVDERNADAVAWLERRGYVRSADVRTNLLIAVRGNPRVSAQRASEAGAAAAARGYEVRRARADETALVDAIAGEFGGAWPFEVRAAGVGLGDPTRAVDVHVALRDGAYCAFAAHDGNNRGLGWFGPTGTWPAHRGQGLGEALLLACLVDVAADHDTCEIAWIGPRPFYDKVAGIAGERRFVALSKTL